MKISLGRHGIVLKTIPIQGDHASIGTGEECAIRLDDPYLSAHIADLTFKEGQWRITDSGTALEGVSRGGSRVEDEPLLPDEIYSIGAFELVATEVEGSVSRATQPAQSAAPPVSPGDRATIAQSQDEGNLPPKTMWAGEADYPKTEYAVDLNEVRRQAGAAAAAAAPPPQAAAPPGSGKSAAAGAGGMLLRPVTEDKPAPARQAPARSSRRRLILLGGMAALLVLLLVVVLVATGGKEEVAPPVVEAEPAPPPPPPPPAEATAGQLAAQGDELARTLQIDKAVAAWSAAIDKGAGAETRAKLLRTSLEMGLAYRAAGQNEKANELLQTVVRVGPGTPEAARAQAALPSG
ncbi:MAG TPA: FHA domain-containing protein [Thermoanaerobaculia bacterium]|nr:FHA domain-containing protein [Thermoanaerobaculia bacterium]